MHLHKTFNLILKFNTASKPYLFVYLYGLLLRYTMITKLIKMNKSN